jgi:DNA-binding transcriptional regulator YbjK
MKHYKVEFVLLDGSKEVVEFTTDRLKWTINQWLRNRSARSHKVLSEGSVDSKEMLLG